MCHKMLIAVDGVGGADERGAKHFRGVVHRRKPRGAGEQRRQVADLDPVRPDGGPRYQVPAPVEELVAGLRVEAATVILSMLPVLDEKSRGQSVLGPGSAPS